MEYEHHTNLKPKKRKKKNKYFMLTTKVLLDKGTKVYTHEAHIDLDIPLGLLPFDIKFGEVLTCAVKGYQKMGVRTDGVAHIFITKSDSEQSIADQIITEEIAELHNVVANQKAEIKILKKRLNKEVENV